MWVILFNQYTRQNRGWNADDADRADNRGSIINKTGRRIGERHSGLARCTLGDGFAIYDTCRDLPAPQVLGDRAADGSGSDGDEIFSSRQERNPWDATVGSGPSIPERRDFR
jgi:hypothetical protein